MPIVAFSFRDSAIAKHMHVLVWVHDIRTVNYARSSCSYSHLIIMRHQKTHFLTQTKQCGADGSFPIYAPHLSGEWEQLFKLTHLFTLTFICYTHSLILVYFENRRQLYGCVKMKQCVRALFYAAIPNKLNSTARSIELHSIRVLKATASS